MRSLSHITIIRTHLEDYRKEKGWSRESLVQEIVEAHERNGNDKISGIQFEPKTSDPFGRMKVNADRVYRWLDDQTKDNNLLPSNFVRSIYSALPIDRRVRLLNDLLRDQGVTVSSVVGGVDFNPVNLLQSIIKEAGEAQSAMAALCDGATRDELLVAQREITEAVAAMMKGLIAIESALAGEL